MTGMTMSADRPRPIVLCVLDGWGHRQESDHNAILQARTPNWDALLAQNPWSLIDASELHVGLPGGQMGNSEVGHMNIGAGRVVMQDLPRIDAAIAEGAIVNSAQFKQFVGRLRQSGGTCHVLGLLSPGGVHSHQGHIVALARLLGNASVPVALHAFLDGRDTPPSSAREYLAEVTRQLSDVRQARFATIGGRYFGMDRDQRWERVQCAYDAFLGKAEWRARDADAAIGAAYDRGETDEFVLPTIIGDFAGMRDGDGVLMGNFRADRARQILTALLEPDFTGFARTRRVQFAAALGMVEYSRDLAKLMPALFPPSDIRDTLGELVAKADLRQLRIAETEKYAHVTFFFNGGEERLFAGEERILVPSPKVATYDLKPEMSADEVTDRLIGAIGEDRFDFIVVNYANTDMVGHSGNLDAAIKAVEAVDRCLGRLHRAIAAKGGILVITADHGNAELMLDARTGESHTAHTLNRVPFVVVGVTGRQARDGRLADVAPTILELMGLEKPAAMTGASLLMPGKDRRIRVAG